MPYTDTLIERIASCQSRGDAFFPDGIFPAYRHNKYLFYRRPDTNIFYTATIVFILNQVKLKVSAKSQKLIEQITEKTTKNYPDYQNKDGLKTYNFWPTKPSKHFPNGLIFKHFDHFRIPDDIDDTALIYLTFPHSKEDVQWLKEKVKLHSPPAPRGGVFSNSLLVNLKGKNEFLAPPLGAGVTDASGAVGAFIYSTWFGKNMPIEHDVCALCNLMYLFERHQLPHNAYDEAVFAFLREVILEEKYIYDAFKVAHNYATTQLIIYHYARLLGDFEIPQLEICREKLIQKIVQLLAGSEPHNEQSAMNKVILETSLLKLKGLTEIVSGDTDNGTEIVSGDTDNGKKIISGDTDNGTEIVSEDTDNGKKIISEDTDNGTEIVSEDTDNGTKIVSGDTDNGTRTPLTHRSSLITHHSFTYFIAGLLSSYRNPILYFFAPLKITHIEWTCEAHELALLVEQATS